jgi:hypothetical protein
MEKKIDLFNNPMVASATKALTDEQREQYRIMGEHMFNTMTFDNTPNPQQELRDLLLYTRESLKSGLHPSDLNPKEIQAMYEIYGDKWYEEFGYTADEVPQNPVGCAKVEPPKNENKKKKTSKQLPKKILDTIKSRRV